MIRYRIVRFIYNLLLVLAWPLGLVYYLVRSRTGKRKYAKSFPYRMGLRQEVEPDLPDASVPRIWVHALSVGETISVVPLVRALREQGCEIVFSNATETGATLARKRLSPWVSRFFYLPHDFPWASGTLLDRLKPSAFILVETDVWPNLLGSLQKRSIPAFLVNGRISPGSLERYRCWFKGILRPVLRTFDLVFAQSEADKARYESLGALDVRAEGNLKFDAASVSQSEEKIRSLRESTGIQEIRPVWVAGSTHEGEEAMVLKAHKAILARTPDALLVLAPRNVARGPEIVSLCHSFGLSVAVRSQRERAFGKNVYLLDTLGELADLYGLADCAFIGGSLVPFGGHNPLEASGFGKPVLWGPHMFNFREIEEVLAEAGCGRRIASDGELERVIGEWLSDARGREAVSAAARELFARHAGVSGRIARTILERLHRQPEGRNE